MKMLVGIAGIVGLALLSGCSSSIDAEDYARACADTLECVVISVGDICDCGCEYAAINVADYPRYQEDRSDIECGNECGPCPGALPSCEEGMCEAR
jgi:hypothetical protein